MVTTGIQRNVASIAIEFGKRKKRRKQEKREQEKLESSQSPESRRKYVLYRYSSQKSLSQEGKKVKSDPETNMIGAAAVVV